MHARPLPAAFLLVFPIVASSQPPAGRDGSGEHDHQRAKAMTELVVTASPLQPGSEEVLQPVEVLAGEALDARKAGTLGETVAKEVGVQSSFFGAGVGRPILRGQDGARVRVLAGGLGTLDASTVSADHAVSIEPFLADQIEILKGPATLLYGSGAVGGAVNVVDGRIPEVLPGAPLIGRAELRGGTGADERSGMFRLDGEQGDWAWHADALRRDASDYDIPGFAESAAAHDADESQHDEHQDERGAVGFLPNSSLETEAGAFGATWIGDRGSVGASISTYRSNYGIPGHAHEDEEHHEKESHDEAEHEGAQVRIDLDQVRYDLKGTLLTPFAGAESLRMRVGRSDYEHVELEGDEVGTRFANRGTEGRVELVHTPLGGWRGATGTQFSKRDFSAVGGEAFVPASLSRDLGLFLLEERELDRWKFEFGGRYEQIEVDPEGQPGRDFAAISASFGAVWHVSEALHVSLGFDRAERAPGAEELFSDGAHLATQSYELGDPTLDTEVANQLELGAHLHAGAFSAKLAAFENRYDDFIYLADHAEEIDDLPLRAWTQADSTFRELEAEATLRLVENASGAWDLRVFGDRVRATLDAGGNLPRMVPARLGAGLQWEREGWRASLGAIRHAKQGDTAAFETATRGYTLIDAHLAYHWDDERIGWEVFVDGNNLSNRDARVHTSFLKDLAPLPGRNLAFGVRVFF